MSKQGYTDFGLRATPSEKSVVLEWLLKRIVVKGCAELWNASTLVKLDDQNAAVRLFTLSYCCNDKRSSIYKNRNVNLLSNNRHWSYNKRDADLAQTGHSEINFDVMCPHLPEKRSWS